MNVVRVSALEAFRRWRNDENSSVDDLFHVPETEAMRVGTALHKALELEPDNLDARLRSTGYVRTVIRSVSIAISGFLSCSSGSSVQANAMAI